MELGFCLAGTANLAAMVTKLCKSSCCNAACVDEVCVLAGLHSSAWLACVVECGLSSWVQKVISEF